MHFYLKVDGIAELDSKHCLARGDFTVKATGTVLCNATNLYKSGQLFAYSVNSNYRCNIDNCG